MNHEKFGRAMAYVIAAWLIGMVLFVATWYVLDWIGVY